MCVSNQSQIIAPDALRAESERYYSQAVGACLARLQRSVDLLQQPLLSEVNTASLLFDIEVQTDRLNTLMRQVLSAGGLEALAAGDGAERVPLADVLATLLAEYQAACPAREFDLRLEGLPTTAAYALPCVRLVVQLLLDNAVRCTPEGGHIAVVGEDEAAETGWVFHVQDGGAGLAPDQLATFFENPSQAAPAAVYGLGLTLAKFIVEAFGGEIWVESQAGAGATFSFSLPRHVLPRRWTVFRPKVLVIEENSELCATLKSGFEEAGFEVETSASAEAGLSLVSTFAPNLVLLELSPTSLAGQACLTTVRQCSDAAVIFLVSPDEREAVPDALWQGASDCLVKPFHIRELIARTRAILRRRPVGPRTAQRSLLQGRFGLIQRPKLNSLLQ